jgi:hypothetical protein
LRIAASERIGLSAIHTPQYALTVFRQHQLPGLVASWTDGRGGLNLGHLRIPVLIGSITGLSVTDGGR